MRITGRNLKLVAYGLQCAVWETRNFIATCPEPEFYAKDLEQSQRELEALHALLAKVQSSISKESAK